MDKNRRAAKKSNQKLPPPISLSDSDYGDSLSLSSIHETKNKRNQVLDYEMLIKNSNMQVDTMKEQIQNLTQNLLDLSSKVEKIIPEEIKTAVPNLGQSDYVISVVQHLSSLYIAKTSSRYTSSVIQKLNNENQSIVLQNEQLKSENSQLKATNEALRASEMQLNRKIQESERVRLEVLRENEAKTKQINDIEAERVSIIRRLTEELKKKDETLENIKRSKFGKQIPTNIPEIDQQSIIKTDELMKFSVKQLQDLLKEAQTKDIEKDNRIKSYENNLLQLQNELKNNMKTISDLKQVIEEKNRIIYNLENKQTEIKKESDETLSNELQATKQRLNEVLKQLEECQKQLSSQMNKPQTIDETNKLRSAIIEKDGEIQNLGESLHLLSTEKEEIQMKYERKLQKVTTTLQNEKQKISKQLNDQILQLKAQYSQETIKMKNQMKEENLKLTQFLDEEKQKNKNLMKIFNDQNPREIVDEYHYLKDENIAQSQKIREMSEEREDLQSTILDIQKTLQNTKVTLSQKETEINDMKLQMQQMTSVNDFKEVVLEKQELEKTLEERESFIKSLQSQISSQIDECKTKLKDQNTKLIENLAQTNTRLEERETKLQRLQSCLVDVEKQNQNLKEKLRVSLEENCRLGSEIEKLNKHMENTNIEIEINNDAILDLNQTIDKLTKEKENLTKLNEEYLTEKEQMKKSLKKMEKKYDKLQSSISQKEMQLSELQDTIEKVKTEKSSQINSLIKKVEEKENQIRQTENTIKEMQMSQTVIEQNHQNEKQINEGKIKEFEKKVSKLEKIVFKLKDYINNLQIEKEKYEKKFKELKQIAKNQMQTSLDFQSESEKNRESRLTSEMAFQTLSKKYNDLQSKYNERNNAIETLSKDLELLRNQVSEKNDQIQTLNSKIENQDEMKQEILKLQNKLQTFIESNDKNQKELEETKNKVNEEKEKSEKLKIETESKENDLIQKINELNLTIASLTEQTKNPPVEFTKKMTELEIINKKVTDDLQKIKEESEKQKRVLKKENDELKSINADYKKQIIDLSNDVDLNGTNFENKLSAKVREIQDLKMKNENLMKSLEDLKLSFQEQKEKLVSENASLNSKLETNQNNLNNLTTKEKQISDENKKLLTENGEMKNKITVLTKQNDDMNDKLSKTKESFDNLNNEYQEYKRTNNKQIDELNHQINDQKVDIMNLSKVVEKKQNKIQEMKEDINQSVNIKDFEKLNKKYLAVKNLYEKSEKKVLSTAIDQGTIREQQMSEFLAKIETQQKEIDDLKEKIKNKEDFIRKLQRQIATDGQKLEEITSQPFVPLVELTNLRQEMRDKEKQLNESLAKIKFLEEKKANDKADYEDEKTRFDKERKSLKELVDMMTKKVETLNSVTTKMTVFHSILTNQSTMEQNSQTILEIMKSPLNELFSHFGLEEIETLGRVVTLTISSVNEDFDEKPYIDERVSKKIDEVLSTIDNLPIKTVNLKPLEGASPLIKLTQISTRLKQISTTMVDRDSLIQRMSKLVESQHQAVVRISECPKDEKILKLSSINLEESNKIVKEITKGK